MNDSKKAAEAIMKHFHSKELTPRELASLNRRLRKYGYKAKVIDSELKVEQSFHDHQ